MLLVDGDWSGSTEGCMPMQVYNFLAVLKCHILYLNMLIVRKPFPISTHSVSVTMVTRSQRVKSLGNLADLRDLNQDYHMRVQSSGHSDSDSVSVRMRDQRSYTMTERPMSMHVTATPVLQVSHTPKVS